jgi:CheY-like chemotaxis protein
MQVIVKHIIEPPPPLRSINPNVPEEIERVVMRALEKKPENRYQSASEFADELMYISDPFGELRKGYNTGSLGPPLTAASMPSESATPPADMGGTIISPVSMPQDAGQTVIGAVAMPNNAANDAANDAGRTVIGNVGIPQGMVDNNRTVIGAVAPITGKKKQKILIVNNSKAIVMLLKHQISQAGFEVVTQFQSIEAMVTIVQEKPDLIILGVEMPELSGPDLCKMIRTRSSLAEFAQVPIFLYSTMSESELEKTVQECQASGFIHKTWTMDMVMSKLLPALTK